MPTRLAHEAETVARHSLTLGLPGWLTTIAFERRMTLTSRRSARRQRRQEQTPSHRFHRGLGRSSLMLVTPAWAHASSLSPPGEPPTPSAPTISSPALIATAPGSSAMSGNVASAAPLGFLAASAANSPEVLNRKIGPKVATVYALRKAEVVVPMVEWS